MADRRTGLFMQRRGVLLDDAGDLIAGVSAALRRLGQAGVALVVVDNDEPGSGAAARLELLLADEDVRLDANLFSGEAEGHRRRLPRPGMLLEAAERCAIDLLSSWVVSADHVLIEAGAQAGCCGAVLIGHAADPERPPAIAIARARDLADAPRVMIPPGGGCWHARR